jgi:hypothetical protein
VSDDNALSIGTTGSKMRKRAGRGTLHTGLGECRQICQATECDRQTPAGCSCTEWRRRHENEPSVCLP